MLKDIFFIQFLRFLGGYSNISISQFGRHLLSGQPAQPTETPDPQSPRLKSLALHHGAQ